MVKKLMREVSMISHFIIVPMLFCVLLNAVNDFIRTGAVVLYIIADIALVISGPFLMLLINYVCSDHVNWRKMYIFATISLISGIVVEIVFHAIFYASALYALPVFYFIMNLICRNMHASREQTATE